MSPLQSNREDPERARSRARYWVPGLLVAVLVTGALVAAIRYAGPPIYCGDGWFNIRYAEVIREHGPSRHYPIWQETFLRDHFADKEFLYHVLLIPFTLGDLLSGARLAAVFFACLAMATFYFVARLLRAPAPLLWTLALVACSSDFLFRLTFTRSLVLAMSVALAGTCAVLLGRGWWAFALAAVYANTHVSFHLLPCLAFLNDLHRDPLPGRGRWSRFRMVLFTLGGTAAGLLVSPFVPHNIRLWWSLNFRVLWAAWAGGAELRPVTEVGPLLSSDLLVNNTGVFLALLAAAYVLSRARRVSADARILLVVSAGFLALTMLSQRFVEMWAPFTILLAAVAVRDARESERLEGEPDGPAREPAPAEAPHPARSRAWTLAAVLGAVAVAGLLAFNFEADRREAAEEESAQFEGASAWMGANVPAGDTIFHLWMDDYAEIYFFNPQLRCLVGWDSTLMLVTDPARYRLWTDVALGRVDDVFAPIRETFRCRWVCASAKDRRFLAIARRDPRFRVVYEDRTASVFRLEDDGSLLGGFKVTGWYPDPARRLFDLPLGPEPGAAPGNGVPGPQGPAAAGLALRDAPGFVNLGRALAVPPLVADACAVAETTLAADVPVAATLAVTTDDEIKVYVNGEAILEASPYRHPLPGRPGGPPLALGDLRPAGSHLEEKSARVELRAGENDVIVKTCRAGDEFGFFLRAVRADGSPVRSGAAPAPAER